MAKDIQKYFVDIIQNVSKQINFTLFMKEASIKYDINPYKITKIYPYEGRKIYISTIKKYEKGISEVTQNQWHQNQRKIFIWFLLFYCYSKNKQPNQLVPFLQKQDDHDLELLSNIFFQKNVIFLQFQCQSITRHKGRTRWLQHQDEALRNSINIHGEGKWNQIAKDLFFRSEKKIFRTPKQCRERWLNHLDPIKSKKLWTDKEDQILFNFIEKFGKKWAKVVPLLNYQRTQHMIKNRYLSMMRKFQKVKIKQESFKEEYCSLEKRADNNFKNQQEIIQKQKDQQKILIQSQNQKQIHYVQTPSTIHSSPYIPFDFSSNFFRSVPSNFYWQFLPGYSLNNLFFNNYSLKETQNYGFVKHSPEQSSANKK